MAANDINGLLNYKIRELGAFHMIDDDAYEPQRTNNFEMHIYFNDRPQLTTVEKSIEIDSAVAEDTLILSTVTVGALTTDVSVIPIAYGNTKVKYAGLPDVQNSQITYNDFIGKATERVITAWHKQVADMLAQTVGRKSTYAKRALLVETAPDGTNVRGWRIDNCWPSTLTLGEYSYNGGGQVRQIQMTLVYDRLIPLDADEAGNYTGVAQGRTFQY